VVFDQQASTPLTLACLQSARCWQQIPYIFAMRRVGMAVGTWVILLRTDRTHVGFIMVCHLSICGWCARVDTVHLGTFRQTLLS
jgi:hypothetical protein